MNRPIVVWNQPHNVTLIWLEHCNGFALLSPVPILLRPILFYFFFYFFIFYFFFALVFIVGFFIPVSSLKVFGHSIHSERIRIYLGKSIQALQNDTIIISWVFSFRVIQPTVRWHTFKTFMFVFIDFCSS